MDIGVAVFVYNRLDHTKKMLETLVSADEFSNYQIYIFSDGAREKDKETVFLLRKYLREFSRNYKNIHISESKVNRGCKGSIVYGINELFKKYEAVISIEDDVVISKGFLNYMKVLLEMYKEVHNVGCVTGFKHPDILFKIPDSYPYDIFFVCRTSSWGWGTWRDRWMDVDWDLKDLEDFKHDYERQRKFNIAGEDLSRMLIEEGEWDLIWAYHNFKNNWLTIYPTRSYIENIGLDGSGLHCAAGEEAIWEIKTLNEDMPTRFPQEASVDKRIERRFQRISTKGWYSKVRGLKKKLFRIYKTFTNLLYK